ncbi:unnamed protein product [Linum trigynum]|uniref:Bet v I/Major latex protein domain-containing protein n=1 Tax=Linum trigynum TaxID=586398 RepID=A0AAV2DKB6_9ROSI
MAGFNLLSGKLEVQFAIRLPASQHHEIFSARPHHVSNMAPAKVRNCAVHEGHFGQKGTIIEWDYVHDGEKKLAKQIVEDMDDVNFSTSFKMIEGDLMKEYKEFMIVVKATPKSESTSLIHWTLEYEKLSEDIPEPFSLLQFFVHLSKDIDDHHAEKEAK